MILPVAQNRSTGIDRACPEKAFYMRAHNAVYRSYLLRMWRESKDGEWHASLQDVATSECKNFANLNALFAFLSAQGEFSTPNLINGPTEVRGLLKKKE